MSDGKAGGLKRRISDRFRRKDNGQADDRLRIYISPITFVMAVVFVAIGMAYEFACCFTAVVLHEFAHAKLAKRLGYELNEIKIMPYGAALCGNVDITPKHEISIAAIGPIFNLVLATVFAAMWWLIPVSYAFTGTFCMCNMYIGLFNLLPVYPLDGGRIAFALLSAKLKRQKAYLVMRIISLVMGLVAIALFCVSAVYALNPCFLSVGLFMTVSALIPDARARYRALFSLSERRSRMKKPIEVKICAVTADTPSVELCSHLDPDRFCIFRIYDDGMNAVGEIDEISLVEFVKQNGYDKSISDVMRNNRKMY